VDVDVEGRFQLERLDRQSKYGRPYGNTTVAKTMAHMPASFNRNAGGSASVVPCRSRGS
jgi:hypothetical protein